jgi:hypothetical protein
MKSKTLLLHSIIVIALSILGYGVGRLLGGFLLGESTPSWNHYLLPPSPKKIISIVYYHMSPTSESEDPTGDGIYVKTVDGEYYSYTLFQNDWKLVDVDPSHWENPFVSKCATKWNKGNMPYEFADLKSYPPVEKAAIDSMGVNFWNYPSTSVARCYTLLDDGSLQGWTYSGNVPDLVKNRLWKNVLMVTGAFTGIIVGIFAIHYRIKKMELVKT